MLQNDGEPAWQGKTYNALKDKKHLTGINKEVLNISVNDVNYFVREAVGATQVQGWKNPPSLTSAKHCSSVRPCIISHHLPVWRM